MTAVATTIDGLSTTAANNGPAGTDAVGTTLDDNLRTMQAVVRQLASPNSIASASTTDLSTINDTFITVSGVTTITALGTLTSGVYKWLIFSGVLTLTHNGTSLILPSGANITTAAGDIALMLSAGAGNWRCLAFQKASGQALIGGNTGAAAQTDQETATSTTTFVSPGRQQYHPSAVKGWVEGDNAGGLTASYNVTSLTDNGAGDITVVWDIDFSSANYCVQATSNTIPGGSAATSLFSMVSSSAQAAGTIRVVTVRASDGLATDPSAHTFISAYGDQ